MKPRAARSLEVKVSWFSLEKSYWVAKAGEEWGFGVRVCTKYVRRLFGPLPKTGEHRFVVSARRVK